MQKEIENELRKEIWRTHQLWKSDRVQCMNKASRINQTWLKVNDEPRTYSKMINGSNQSIELIESYNITKLIDWNGSNLMD